jgi:alpha-amylase/alpha-mannosidase (GH57 family)
VTAPPLRVVFLWHFHQPWYPTFDGVPPALPWVRLHALKDYFDLPALLSEEPRIHHAANLVPALLDQIDLLTRGGSDAFLEVARTPATEWDLAAVRFARQNFFAVHPRILERFPRLADLRRRAEEGEALSSSDLTDLVVLFHLAWSGPALQKDPLVIHLRKRGHGFTETEKNALLDHQAAFLGRVIPAWKRAFESGLVEAVTSPYHHPILPLLLDSSAGRDARPDLPVPVPRFSHSDDARSQIALGLGTFERHFGFRPRGMWPPEGALSEGTLALLGEAGVAWTASDEAVLLQSLPAARRDFGEGDRARTVFRPWRLAGVPSPDIFFRDRILSDRIGFSYATWDPADAAADFVARLLSIRAAAPEAELVVPVILDGENAWETYPDNGAPFLRALAAALAARQDFEVVTPSEALARLTAPPASLERVIAGSWVDGNLATWIGAPPKNKAWSLLHAAREALGGEIAAAPVVSPVEVLNGDASPAAAKAALFAAEASDWFWWLGDDHSSAHDAVFDELYRRHLAAAYRAAARPVPPELLEPVDPMHGPEFVPPGSALWPAVDGLAGEADWAGAGCVRGGSRGAMHRSAGLVKQLLFGASAAGDTLFLRLDPEGDASAFHGWTLRVEILPPGDGDAPVSTDLHLSPGVTGDGTLRVGLDRVLEVRLPCSLGARAALSFRIALLDADGRMREAIPEDGWVRFRPPGPASSPASLRRARQAPA